MSVITKITNTIKQHLPESFSNIISTFFANAQDNSTKEFLVYLCLDFSFLINGIFLVCIGDFLPIFNENITENYFRTYLGAFCIAMWFCFLPNVSQDTKTKIAHSIVSSVVALIAAMVITHHWFSLYLGKQPIFPEILIWLISIPTTAYFIYCLTNLFKLIFFIIQKILDIILPDRTSAKNILLYTIQTLTALFIAISSCIVAFWGIVTAIKPFFGQS